MDITLIPAIIAALISAGVTLLINRRNNRKHIDDQLDNILKIAVQYPYLESYAFTKTWNEKKATESEECLRYDLYCTLLFNYLSRLAKYFKYDKQKLDNYLAVKEWVRLHKDYWLNPYDTYENIDAYEKKFRELVSEYIK